MAEIKNPIKSEMGHQVTGKVAILYGTVKAISPDGTVRILKVNSPVYADDRIITGDDGSLSIVFNTFPPTQLDLGRVSDMVIDEDVYGAVSPDVMADATAQQEAIQEALLAGDQPLDLEATAAGTESNAGGGHPIFVVTPDWAEVTPESGAETRGITWGTEVEKEYAVDEESSAPNIIINAGNVDGGPDTVYEAGFNPDGSSAGDDSVYASGSFNVSDPDGLDDIAGVTINGQYIPINQLEGILIPGTNGNLTIISYNPATGEAEYEFELTGPTSGEGVTEDFHLTVTDNSGLESAPATITINIADDVPNAVNDTKSIAEDTTTAITGNVLENDLHPNGQPGADTPTSFVAWDSTAAAYGTFTDTGDGTYSYTLDNTNTAVQALKTGETLQETFSYTMQDADGDQDTATLTITINGTNDVPTITTDPGNVEGGLDTVYESGLAAGSNAAANTEFAYGTFTVSDPDGLDDIDFVTINGTDIPIGSLVGSVISTSLGDLTITGAGADPGSYEYTYELKTPTTDVNGVDETDTFTLTVTDNSGLESDPATITINIADDIPNAVNDTKSITEDATPNYITGDVLANDTTGADTPIKDFSWGSTSASYGTFEDTGNGTYKYTLNNNNATVDGLKAGETLEETFTYSFTDADGDPASAELKITINGSNDGPHITTDPGNVEGGLDTVYESGLAAGSNAAADTEFAYGTFTVSDPDGLSDIQSVTINGTPIAIASLAGTVITGANGTLTVTAYNSTTGVAEYTYQLTSPTTDGAGTETNVFTLTTSDGTSTSAPATITINIADDVPTAYADTNSVVEGALVTGNVLIDGTDDVFGADGPIVVGGGVVGVKAGSDTTIPVTTGVGAVINGAYGNLTLNADGSYSYDGNPDAVTSAQSDVFVYTIQDGDGDLSTTTLTINLTDSGLIAPDDNDVKVYEKALDTSMDGSDLAASTYTGSFPGDTGETDAINQLTAAGGTGPYTYELVGSPTGSYGVIQINADGSYIYTLTKPYDTTPDADNGMNTEENKESFTYKVTDANGNTAQGTITVDIVDDIPTAHPQEYSIEVETPVTTAQIGALAAGWVAPFDSNVDNQYNTDADIYAEKIAWGDSSSSSSYVYNDNNALANVNIGEKFTLGTFTHNNFPIPSGSSITAANLRVTFDVVINGQTVHVDHTIQFQHNETPNDGANSDDIVTIINGTNVVNITVGDATYQLTIGFQDAAGNTVTQVYTDENESTSFNLNGTLALVSMVSTPDVVGTVDADFGADGPAALPIVSIAHDFDGDGTVEVYNTSSTGYNVGTTTLTLTTHEGGTFTMNFSTGDYTYTAPTNPLLGSDEIFEYTIIDADGDTATSTLTFNLPVENMLVVGTNVDDQAGQTVDHYIDNVAPFDGPITGGAGNDILVGDIGGANSVVQPGHNYNISLIVDSSGSMDKASGTAGYTRMELAKEALKNLANQLVDHDGIINLQIIDFDSNVVANISWSNITSDNLSAIYKAIDDMVAGGATNYEAGFDSARNWLSSQTNGYENITFFLTDGNPTYYLNSSGNVAGPGNVTDYSTMLNSVQAFALLSPLSSVEAIGIGSDVNENYLKFFDNTDVTGTGSVSFWNGTVRGPVGEVEIVNTSEELSAALQHGSSEYTLLEAGDDHLIGGDSDDIIFGDSVNTDALADANALSTPDGAGWAVFQQLGWSEQQIMDYIKTNHLSLSAESGRTGGNDIIDGGAGDDIIYGQEGNDILSGGTGNNILSGGSGADTFVISSGAHDTILDYSKADGDKVDISSVLDEGAGDHLNVIANADGSVKLEILDSSNVEKASISFETINYSDLNDMGAGNELDSLLNKVVIDH